MPAAVFLDPALQLAILLAYMRLFAGRRRAGDALAALLLLAGLGGAVSVHSFNGLKVFYLAVLYFILVSARLKPAAKLWLLTGWFFAFARVFMAVTGLTDTIVRLHFFNSLFSSPVRLMAAIPLFRSDVFFRMFNDFASGQSLFWFSHTYGLLLFVCAGYGYVVFLIAAKSSPLPAGPPPPGAFRLPWWTFYAGLFLFALDLAVPSSYVLKSFIHSGWSISMALFAIQGFSLLGKMSPDSPRTRIILFTAFCVSLFAHELLYLLAIIGILDCIFGLSLFASQATSKRARIIPASGEFRAFLLSLCLITAVVTVFSLIILKTSPDVETKNAALPSARPTQDPASFTFNETETEIKFSSPGETFFIDKYEFPNKRGETPAREVSPELARALCAERGKHLCTPREWAMACRAGAADSRFYVSRDQAEANRLLFERCEWRKNQAAPSGSRPECKNPAGVHDMTGNVWEWVDTGAGSGVNGLMGPGAGTGCQICNSCEWIGIVYDNQLKMLPTDDIGFRCCGE